MKRLLWLIPLLFIGCATTDMPAPGAFGNPGIFDTFGMAISENVPVSRCVTTLTTAQMLDLQDTPITLIAAQGANTIIEVVSAIFTYDYATAAFTVSNADDDMTIEYADGTDIDIVEATGFIDQADDEMRYMLTGLATDADLGGAINQAVRITNAGTAEFTNGGGEVDIRLIYRVFSTGF